MVKNKYTNDFDRKINLVLSQHEQGEISEKVLAIVLGLLFERYYGGKISKTLKFSNENPSRSMGFSLKKITEYYNGSI